MASQCSDNASGAARGRLRRQLRVRDSDWLSSCRDASGSRRRRGAAAPVRPEPAAGLFEPGRAPTSLPAPRGGVQKRRSSAHCRRPGKAFQRAAASRVGWGRWSRAGPQPRAKSAPPHPANPGQPADPGVTAWSVGARRSESRFSYGHLFSPGLARSGRHSHRGNCQAVSRGGEVADTRGVRYSPPEMGAADTLQIPSRRIRRM